MSMDEFIWVGDQYYIRASSDRMDDRTRVLKHGDTFAVFDRHGDVRAMGLGEQGLYHDGTRFLSHFELTMGGMRPLLLSSMVKDDNALLTVDLTNSDIALDGQIAVPRGTLHIFRAVFLWEGCCYTRLRITNYGLAPAETVLGFRCAGDFADIFEVRGTRRDRKGTARGSVNGREIHLGYEGLDRVVRTARIMADREPTVIEPSRLAFALRLEPQSTESLYLTVACDGARPAPASTWDVAAVSAAGAAAGRRGRATTILTSNEQFNDWVHRSSADIHMMITDTPLGGYPYAGVPWFSTPFGRDGIITALEYLWMDSGLALGVLRFLASTQADSTDPARDAEPGKILHEMRGGEMAALGEVPFGRYYGGADTTPLFVLLAGEYWRRTGDREVARELWPHVERALGWMRQHGDPDGDGFLEYTRVSERGLVNQGWKDSSDSVFHADGRLASPPIAMCEIQGYAYAALQAAADLAEALELPGRAGPLREEAERLREKIEQAFWCEDLGTYALALDGEKLPCRVRSSNPGHLLYCGVPSPERAARVAATLLATGSDSGWGIRTVAVSEPRYNPMSYHNGSVWPHDNALIAQGFARYGLKLEAMRVLTELFDASLFAELHRMPELFCGFPRREGEGPTEYPVACAPQSWAAAAVFLLIQACLGLSIDGVKREVRFNRPALPPWLQSLQLTGLRAGEATLDLDIMRLHADVSVAIVRREGRVDLVTVK
ncbi:MAG: amylo-alpha-1,6-glucosidase [Gemmatimonadales bacterium]